MVRDVPECSGMFHVPGFIDGHMQVYKGQTIFWWGNENF